MAVDGASDVRLPTMLSVLTSWPYTEWPLTGGVTGQFIYSEFERSSLINWILFLAGTACACFGVNSDCCPHYGRSTPGNECCQGCPSCWLDPQSTPFNAWWESIVTWVRLCQKLQELALKLNRLISQMWWWLLLARINLTWRNWTFQSRGMREVALKMLSVKRFPFTVFQNVVPLHISISRFHGA
jgi:hypothetical protein